MGLFEPDILNDHLVKRGARACLPPEWRLMAAILIDAIDCLRKNFQASGRRRHRMFREAEEWILSDDLEWIFSFRNICDVLALDPAALREAVEAWKHLHLGTGAPEQHFGLAS